MKIEVYTDGSATTKDKPGGYGWVIVKDGTKILEGSGYSPGATNNDMELEGAIQGLLEAYKLIDSLSKAELMTADNPNIYVEIVSDSEIVLKWITGEYRFKQYDKIKKFEQLMRLVKTMDVKTRWVEGHTGVEHNERCDELANEARLSGIVEPIYVPGELSPVEHAPTGELCISSPEFLRQT